MTLDVGKHSNEIPAHGSGETGVRFCLAAYLGPSHPAHERRSGDSERYLHLLKSQRDSNEHNLRARVHGIERRIEHFDAAVRVQPERGREEVFGVRTWTAKTTT